MTDTLFELSGVSKRHPMGETEVEAVRNVTLRMHAGEGLAIVGPSGAGKSTLASIIGCLERPTTGNYEFLGHKVASLSLARLAKLRGSHIGFVFQTFNLLARATAIENVELPLIYGGIPPKRRRNLATEMLERVGLKDRLSHKPSQLSGGQQQRVAVARALVRSPELILADEPTGSLDAATGHEILNLLFAAKSAGTALVIVTHDPLIASRVGRVLALSDGILVGDTAQTSADGRLSTRPL